MFEFPRRKPRRLWISASYLLYKLANALLGLERVMKLTLNAHFLLTRYSWESIAAFYGDNAFEDRTLPDLMRKWIPQGARVVDVGCGSGRIAAIAARIGPVVAIDHKNSFRPRPNVEFREGDAFELATREPFDVAILSHILEHLDDPVWLLRGLRVDVILVEVPNIDYDGRNRIRAKLGLPFHNDDDHVREYTPETLAGHLAEGGWEVEEMIVGHAITLAATRKTA